MDPMTYEISRGWVRLSRWCGYLFVLVAISCLGCSLYAPEKIPLGLAIFGVVFFGGLGLLSLRLGHSAEVYSLEISDDGVRQTSSDAWIPWAGVVSLRDRPIFNRIDLIGPGGPTGISLEYQLEAFQEALDHVLRRVRFEVSHDSQSFRRPLFSWTRILIIAFTIGLSALGAWVWMTEGDWVAPLVIIIVLGGIVREDISQISEVTISSNSLTIRRGFRTTTHALSDISSVKLALRPIGNGGQYLDVFIEVHGKKTPVRPTGLDPFPLLIALESAVTRAAG